MALRSSASDAALRCLADAPNEVSARCVLRVAIECFDALYNTSVAAEDDAVRACCRRGGGRGDDGEHDTLADACAAGGGGGTTLLRYCTWLCCALAVCGVLVAALVWRRRGCAWWRAAKHRRAFE